MNRPSNIEINIEYEDPRYGVGIQSIIGTRQYQQDYGYLHMDKESILAVVCDGMGGLRGGEQASLTAAHMLVSAYRQQRPGNSRIKEFFWHEAQRADQAVSGLTDGRGSRLKAGTTLIAAHITGRRMTYLSVGDSKIYRLGKNGIDALTQEHNYLLMLNEALEKGEISQEQYHAECRTGKAEALISYIGMNGLRKIDVSQIELQKDEIILLCSDGIYKSLNDNQIWGIVKDNEFDMKLAARRLADMAMERRIRGQDNATALLIQYQPERILEDE